jgi:GMP synthase-like glutamine amidotransferase
MRLLVIQHIAIEHPGIWRDCLAADGVAWDAVEIDAGEPIPPLDDYDALWVMGGPMDVWQVDEHPWLTPEKAAIREAVAERRMPFLGVCLGHQLLAEALGGRVGAMAVPEVGILDTMLTADGEADRLFDGFAAATRCLQWHGAEVVELPPDTTVLARSPACAVQAMRVGRAAYGVQFHYELTPDTIAEWGAVPAYEDSLERILGPGALARLDAESARHRAELADAARRLYDNFMTITVDGRW